MKKTQKQRFLELMQDGHWHNTIELNKISFRYSALIHSMRKEGYLFEKKRDARFPDNIIEMWKLVGSPASTIFIKPRRELIEADAVPTLFKIDAPQAFDI